MPGGVPWTVAFAWAPLILGAYFWAHRVLYWRVLARPDDLAADAFADDNVNDFSSAQAGARGGRTPRAASRAASSLAGVSQVLANEKRAPHIWKLIALTALFATLCDGVLDPGAVVAKLLDLSKSRILLWRSAQQLFRLAVVGRHRRGYPARVRDGRESEKCGCENRRRHAQYERVGRSFRRCGRRI